MTTNKDVELEERDVVLDWLEYIDDWVIRIGAVCAALGILVSCGIFIKNIFF